MKKINILYIVAIPLIYGWIVMCNKMGNTSPFFYGFAENKETELSHDKPVSIEKIWVTPGQEVKKGQLLMEVKQDAIDFKIENVDNDLERIDIVSQQQRQSLHGRIAQLKAKRTSKISTIEAEIKNLEVTINYHQDLLKDLQSIDTENINTKGSPNQIKLNTLKEKLKFEIEPIDVELQQAEKELAALHTPVQVQKRKLKNEKKYYQSEQKKLKILAPSDGLIGNLLCKEGENISAFSTLINFYESNPTIVKGFVHESLILEVKKQDSLRINSSLHPSHYVNGKVIGLGSRIVEIPERLRKMPDFKTYGREVLIQIPSSNPFLQKEKVMLNSVDKESDDSLASLFSFFKTFNSKEEKKIKNSISANK